MARLLAQSKCQDPHVLDLRTLSPVADYFVIATGSSQRQMASVAREVADLAHSCGRPVLGMDAQNSSRWIVVDLVDVVAHLFDLEARAYYDLESLWGDRRNVDWAAVARPGKRKMG